MGIGTAVMTGLVAGLAVAMPLGAIGVLLVQEGALRGPRRALPGAAAVASVDTLYCALAVLVGGVAAPLVASWRPWPALVGGVALLVIAAIGLRRGLVGQRGQPAPDEPGVLAPGGHRYALFFGLTMINPATLVYFAAIMSGLAGLTGHPTTAAAFVVAVGAASFGWQALLVAAGGLLGGRTGPRVRRATVVVGNVVVAVVGVVTLVRAWR
jgi:arginine exporter protein ArgO